MKIKKWYWVCTGNPEYNRVAFNVEYCVGSLIKAQFLKAMLKRKYKGSDVWIRKEEEHYDLNYKQYKCPDCDNLMSKRELDRNWDWSGPHCNKCGCTGMKMFVSVLGNKKIINGYSAIMGELKQLLGKETMDRIKKKSNV
ncbi:MAG: hypothetical protein PVG65_05590 [Candidatus Thorarchaeota archaeon]|jgi:hypothetical protein